MSNKRRKIQNNSWAHKTYKKLLQQHGRQNWWPADSRFEVMVGAILTQNTAWTNVEKAIEHLKVANLLDAESIVNVRHASLAKHIKPSGYFNVKTKRLKKLCEWYLQSGG